MTIKATCEKVTQALYEAYAPLGFTRMVSARAFKGEGKGVFTVSVQPSDDESIGNGDIFNIKDDGKDRRTLEVLGISVEVFSQKESL